MSTLSRAILFPLVMAAGGCPGPEPATSSSSSSSGGLPSSSAALGSSSALPDSSSSVDPSSGGASSSAGVRSSSSFAGGTSSSLGGAWSSGAVSSSSSAVSSSSSAVSSSSSAAASTSSSAAGGTLTIDVPPGAEVVEPSTGLRFIFPEGAQGTLTVRAVEVPLGPPVPGASMVELRFTAGSLVRMALRRPDADGAADVYALSERRVPTDGPVQPGAAWHALAPASDDGVRVTYALPLPLPNALGDDLASTYAYVEAREDPRDAVLRDKVNSNLSQLEAMMTPELRAVMAARRGPLGLTVRFVENGGETYYDGFTWGPIVGTQPRPLLQLRRDVSDEIVAHEVGHYLTHLLAGDTAYLAIADLAPDENHGLGDNHGRSTLTEEYAYFVSYLLVGAPPCRQPRSVLGRRDPRAVDMPALEGFGCLALGALLNDHFDAAPDWSGEGTVGGGFAPAGEVLQLFQSGATTINALWPALVSFAAAHGWTEAGLGDVLEPMGWSYLVRGKLRDHGGTLVPGGVPVAACEYCSMVVPGADGIYEFTRVGPGKRNLLAYVGGGSAALAEYTLDATRFTTAVLEADAALGPDGHGAAYAGTANLVVGLHGAATVLDVSIQADFDGVLPDGMDAVWQTPPGASPTLGESLRFFLPSQVRVTTAAHAAAATLNDEASDHTCQGQYELGAPEIGYRAVPLGSVVLSGFPDSVDAPELQWTGQQERGAAVKVYLWATVPVTTTMTGGCEAFSGSSRVPVQLGEVVVGW